jgi:hypothetical protein
VLLVAVHPEVSGASVYGRSSTPASGAQVDKVSIFEVGSNVLDKLVIGSVVCR